MNVVKLVYAGFEILNNIVLKRNVFKRQEFY